MQADDAIATHRMKNTGLYLPAMLDRDRASTEQNWNKGFTGLQKYTAFISLHITHLTNSHESPVVTTALFTIATLLRTEFFGKMRIVEHIWL